MLIAEKLLLLAVNDEGRLPMGTTKYTAVKLTAALLAELAVGGHLTLVEHGWLRSATIQRGEIRPVDPLLADAYDELQGHLANRDAGTLVKFLGGRIGGSWDRVVDRLIAGGVLGRDRPSPVLPTQHPVINVAAYQALVEEARTAVQGTGPVRPDVAVAVMLVGYRQLLPPRGPARIQAQRNWSKVLTRTTLAPDVIKVIDQLVNAAMWVVNDMQRHT